MADDPQRNFRSAYYEKMGFRGVEEKKSLEILLKDNPLGVVPPHSDSQALVSQYRLQQFEDVSGALRAMRFTHPSTPSTELYLRMHQLESNRLPRRAQLSAPDTEDENFLAVAMAMEEIIDDPVDCYWLIRGFVNQFRIKFGDSIPHLPKSLEHFLSLEDAALLSYLRTIGALPGLPFDLWFRRCFAGGLPESSLQRVWDKVISGSCKILVFVAVEILLSYKIVIMGFNHPEAVHNFLSNLPQENTEAIVTKAIELWHKHCGTPTHAV
ncbi:hypothetical protein DNTS_032293 [Danionella cerebrum]|uniref:TBC1 domain family member 7 n=1 Tax=Danionella cerebrum TaxID=2873325 RepID=A0A553QGD5_9TELE|nr:hypothetical protein DNTS_032293 [Danionella translucida]